MGRNSFRQVNKFESARALVWKTNRYMALEFMPLVMKPEADGSFWTYPKGSYYSMLGGGTKRAENGTATELKKMPTYESFSTTEYAKRLFMGDIEEAMADPQVRPSVYATEDVLNQILLQFELDTRRFLDDDNNFGTVTDLSVDPTEQFDDYDNSNPQAVMSDIKLALLPWVPYQPSGTAGFVASIPPDIVEVLLQHPRFIDRYKNTDGNLGLTQLAEYLRVDRIVVPAAYINTKDEADSTYLTSPTLEPIWGDDILIAFVDRNTADGTISFGYTPAWRMPGTQNIVDTEAGGLPFRVRDYEDPARGGGGNWREADCRFGHKVVAPQLGVKIKNAIS